MELQQTQIAELKKIMKDDKNKRLHALYQAVYLHLSGYTLKVFAQIIGHNHHSWRDLGG